jgi:predicted MFS family arabinose efflux permease
LLAFRIVAGAFGGMMGTIVVSIVGDIIPLEKRSSAMSMVMLAFSISSIIGMPVGIYLANAYRWSMPFEVIGALSILVFISVAIGIPNVRKHLDNPGEPHNILYVFKRALTVTNQRNALILMFLLILGQFTIIPSISAYMVTNVDIDKSDLAYMYMIGGIATTITMPLIGKIADKYSRANVFTIMAVLSFIPMIIITHMGQHTIVEVLFVSVPFFIFISGRMIPAQTIMTSAVESNERAGYMSINTAIREIAAGISTQIAALVIVDSGSHIENYNIIGYIAVGASIVAIFFVRKIKAVS